MSDLVIAKGLVWRVILMFTHVLTRTVWPTRVRGRSRVPASGAALIVANHQSVLDIPLVAVAAHHRQFQRVRHVLVLLARELHRC